MATKKKTTLQKVGSAIAGAADAVVTAADKNVVKPVGKAVGLVGKSPAKKAAAKPAAKKATASTAKKPAAKKK